MLYTSARLINKKLWKLLRRLNLFDYRPNFAYMRNWPVEYRGRYHAKDHVTARESNHNVFAVSYVKTRAVLHVRKLPSRRTL